VTTWLEVATVAFVAQLSVLPGEKGQFVVAALATRFHPLVVVGGAAAAFGGWTVLEIALGSYLQGLLPELYLELLTGLLFLVFAVMLLRTAPSHDPDPHVIAERRPASTDGGAADGGATDTDTADAGTADTGTATDAGPTASGTAAESGSAMLAGDGEELDVRLPVVGWRVPTVVGGFLPTFALMTVGEFGDKTQLITIGLATQFAAFPSAIWVGEMAAIVPVSLANAYFFHRFAGRFDLRTAHLVGAALFTFFGVDTLQALVTGVSVWETAVESVGGLLASLLVAV
jgi:putative Ca2+/H+ antiporter (TMEM165/GDT1 family)